MEDEVYYSVGGGGLALLAQYIWQRVFTSEGKASEQLVVQLGERIQSQEARLTTLETGLDDERSKRRLAEDKVHVLELYVVALQAELRRHGIDVPGPTPLPPMAVSDGGL